MTPEIITRSFSSDSAVFDKAFFSNYYKLKGKTDNSLIYLDLGAHAGYFSFLALTLGAKRVYCCEPFLDNFKTLLQNTYKLDFVGKTVPFQLGVYTKPIIGKFSTPELIDKIYFDFANIGLITKDDQNFYPCHCSSLDSILSDFCYGEVIDVLKINTTYAEREILQSSELLTKNIKSVCGEITATEEELFQFKKWAGIRNFINFYSEPPNEKGRILFFMSQTPLSDYFNIKLPNN